MGKSAKFFKRPTKKEKDMIKIVKDSDPGAIQKPLSTSDAKKVLTKVIQAAVAGAADSSPAASASPLPALIANAVNTTAQLRSKSKRNAKLASTRDQGDDDDEDEDYEMEAGVPADDTGPKQGAVPEKKRLLDGHKDYVDLAYQRRGRRFKGMNMPAAIN